MPHYCPYCGARLVRSFEGARIEGGHRISVAWVCPSCGQKFRAEYEFTGHLYPDGGTMPERGGA